MSIVAASEPRFAIVSVRWFVRLSYAVWTSSREAAGRTLPLNARRKPFGP
jgi:hypothetical protein